MLLQAVALALLFVGLPLVSAYLSRVEPASGFALRLPRPLALTGALLLGLSLWPFILELILVQERIGFGTIPGAVRQASSTPENWRLSPALVTFALAVLPPLGEEFFFRGYLFSALSTVTRPWLTILITALAFGVFHIFPGGIFAVERLLPSTLMGLVLGWVRWRGSSIWPCVLLHAAHNSLLL